MTLSVPTIFLVIAVNLLAIGIVWVFVARRYPKFPAAVVWAVGCLIGAAGAATSLLRGSIDPLIPVIFGNLLLTAMAWFAWFGLRLFYGRSVPWQPAVICTAMTVALLAVFSTWEDMIAARIVCYSVGQSIPVALILAELVSHRRGRHNGADLAIAALGVVLLLYVARSVAVLADIGGPLSLREFNAVQGIILVLLVFSTMVVNFGFLLMAVDRLREDVAMLALCDDLTGVANRRHLLSRLAEECALSNRLEEPFSILVIDLDEFKAINDSHGHGAGDECLRFFSRTIQGRLRASDLLARIGGDEFCVVLPRTSVRDASAVASDLIAICGRVQVRWNGAVIALSASIGVAQWMPGVSDTPERIMAAADQALYDAKRHGKDRHALHDGEIGVLSPPLRPQSSTIAHLRSA
ncbi:MAG: GGDEF domain-containing protein [Xanthobacteraceae bacterium]